MIKIRVDGKIATLDGELWSSDDQVLADKLNGVPVASYQAYDYAPSISLLRALAAIRMFGGELVDTPALDFSPAVIY